MTQQAETMRAVAIERFGGLETLRLRDDLPIPTIAPDEVLIRLEAVGVGEWDPFEREGGFAPITGTPRFPYVLGSEGAGTITKIGAHVHTLQVGDRVYAAAFLNPKGGFYAEYAAVKATLVSRISPKLTMQQAAVMSGVGLTALRGLDDTLELKASESLVIVGASGGIGHVAVQLAKRIGARVLAIASGSDGAALAKQLGADAAIDGRSDDVAAAAHAFAPQGIDAALVTTGGKVADAALATLRTGGRAAYPEGVDPTPRGRRGLDLRVYNGDPDADILARLEQLIAQGPFDVRVARVYPLSQAAEAQRALRGHHLGKIALQVA